MSDPVRTLIDELIESQKRLDTPVARFATAHAGESTTPLSALSSQLIPLSAPGPGEQYAFQVDLDRCTGCKACVAGCHSLNGLDEEETWRDVGLSLGGCESHPFQQTITSACHHCEDPACLNGCPVVAYEKDPITGVVAHLDDQCIGCSYCVLKCPYDVPKYNDRLGIVRKCDMCHGRLAAGEAPACVQACPTQAISIVKVPTATDSPHLGTLEQISATDSNYTRPTTRYISKKPLPTDLRAADHRTLRPQHAHYALVGLLVGSQLGLGLFIAAALSKPTTEPANVNPTSLIGWFIFAAGLVASVAHLGQPLRAWRVFLGLRTSWLSREAVLFGAAFPLLTLPLLNYWVPLPLIGPWTTSLGYLGLALAALGVICSAMIYIDTRRHFWRPSQSFGRMFGTVLTAALLPLSPALTALSQLAKIALELASLRGDSPSARLQRGPLLVLVIARLSIAGLALTTLTLPPSAHLLITLPLLAAGEFIERTLYFRAVDSPKMPGVSA